MAKDSCFDTTTVANKHVTERLRVGGGYGTGRSNDINGGAHGQRCVNMRLVL